MSIRADEAQLKEGIRNVIVVGKMILLDIAEKVDGRKENILQNFIARSLSQLSSIALLHDKGHFNDAWIVHRSLIDRLIHVLYLVQTDSFEEFAGWSYINEYDIRNGTKGDERFKENTTKEEFKITKEQTNKYNEFKKQNTNWEKPKPEKVLNDHGLDFIYKYGYDFASRTVHPMAGDGVEEFYALTGLEPNPYKGRDNSLLLSNSLLITTMLVQEAINALDIKFIKAVYDYLDNMRKMIETNDSEYKITFIKLSQHFSKGGELSAK